VNDFISINKNASVKGFTQVTFEGWINIDVLDGASQNIYYETIQSDPVKPRLVVHITVTNELRFAGRAPDTDSSASLWSFVSDAAQPLTTDTWFHLVAIFDSTNDIHRIYLNGDEYSISLSEPAFDNTDPQSNPYFGALGSGSPDYFNGTIDEFRISNISRSAEWIRTEYNNQLDPSSFFSIGDQEQFIDITSPVLHDFGVEDPGTGNPQFWTDITDSEILGSGVANVTLNLNGTQYNMEENGSGFWVYQPSFINFRDYYTYQIVNASDNSDNYLSSSSVEKNITFDYDITIPDVQDWIYAANIGQFGTFLANISDNWGIIDSVLVNVTTCNCLGTSTAFMQVNGTDYINDTIEMDSGQIFFKISVNDTAGNLFTSAEHQGSVPVINRFPIVENLTLMPDPLHSNDTLTLTYDFYDQDGDSEGGTEIRWYKNNVLQSNYSDLQLVPDSALERGDVWNVTVRPKDGQDFGVMNKSSTITVKNTAPQVTTVIITPELVSFIVEDENLEIDYIFEDPDLSDTDQSYIKWFRCENNQCVYQKELDNRTFIPANTTFLGQIWYVEITPYDGYDIGSNVRSENKTIEDRPDILSIGIIPQTDIEGHYVLWTNVSSYPINPEFTEPIVIYEIVINNTDIVRLTADYTNNQFIKDWYGNHSLLGSNVVINVLVSRSVTYDGNSNPISNTGIFEFIMEDHAPPRVDNVVIELDDDQEPTNITFTVYTQEYGSGIDNITLYYFFKPVSELDNALTYQNFLRYRIWQSESAPPGFIPIVLKAIDSSVYSGTADFQVNTSVLILYQIQIFDQSGNVNFNAWPDGMDLDKTKKYTLSTGGIPLEEVLTYILVIIVVMLIFSFIINKKFRSKELIGLDIDAVIENIKNLKIKEEEILKKLNLHTLGAVVSFFDQRRGPLPIIYEPAILRDNYAKLLELSDLSFNTTQFTENFETEEQSTFTFKIDGSTSVTSLSFSFSLNRPNARSGAENLTLIILIYKDVFPLISQFTGNIIPMIKHIHKTLDSDPDSEEKVLKDLVELRKLITSICLSHIDLYGSNEIETNDFWKNYDGEIDT
ncbi:MAG: LamG-like jellyroll fold domain-containing protein, partial [Candidatus Kariarchaeaceae archaeon]